MNMTVNEAHEQAAHKDRLLIVRGHVKGRWMEDHVLDWVANNGHRKIRSITANSKTVEVELEGGT